MGWYRIEGLIGCPEWEAVEEAWCETQEEACRGGRQGDLRAQKGGEVMGIEWDEKVETKQRVRLAVLKPGAGATGQVCDATIDDLRRACEAAGLVVETRERAAADLAGRTNLREAYQRLDEQDACLDALSEHVSPDGTVTTPRMVRPSSVIAGIRALQSRLRDARSDLREHDAELEAANARAEKAEADRDDLRAKLEQALTILNAMPDDDIVSAASHMMDVRRRQSEEREALRYSLSTIVSESFGPQPVMTHEELLSFLEDKIRERTRDMASYLARAEKAEAELRAIEEQGGALREAAAAVRGDAERIRSLEAERDQLRAWLEEECRNALRYRIASLEADLAAARARIAELEAPLPEATVEELHTIGHYAQDAASKALATPPEAARAAIRAVAERVRRERCLIARAVAANIDVRVAEDQGGGFLVAAHRAGEDEDVERNVPAAEVPAVLARMLTEVGA